jgi:hypothetical protein
MAFKILTPLPKKRASKPGFSVTKQGQGEVKLPDDISAQFPNGTKFDVMEGDGPDTGWYALVPTTESNRPSLTNGRLRSPLLARGLEPSKRKEVTFEVKDGSIFFKRPG